VNKLEVTLNPEISLESVTDWSYIKSKFRGKRLSYLTEVYSTYYLKEKQHDPEILLRIKYRLVGCKLNSSGSG